MFYLNACARQTTTAPSAPPSLRLLLLLPEREAAQTYAAALTAPDVLAFTRIWSLGPAKVRGCRIHSPRVHAVGEYSFIREISSESDSILKARRKSIEENKRQRLTGLAKIAIEMSVNVCEGCRRLRKRCDKDDCVLQPCLETLWRNNKLYQGNATVFLAKYFGRKRFFELLQDVTEDERPALFKSLLHEACGRTVNPVSGAIGLKTANKWHLCEEAVINVLAGGSLNPVTMNGPCTSSSSSCPYLTIKIKRERFEEDEDVNRLPQLVADNRKRRQHCLNLDLNLSLQPC